MVRLACASQIGRSDAKDNWTAEGQLTCHQHKSRNIDGVTETIIAHQFKNRGSDIRIIIHISQFT
jgi:hypothetical protein